MKQSLSIPTWHQMAMEGTAPPVRIQLMGYSMHPLVRYHKDYVTIIPPDGELKIGDIVLFLDQKRDLPVVHRIWDIGDHSILTWGDNCDEADGWISSELIWGKVILIERGKREIVPDPVRGIRWARFWHQAGKGYRWYRKLKCRVFERMQKLKA